MQLGNVNLWLIYGVAASSTSTLLLAISFVVFVIERQLACWRLGRLPICVVSHTKRDSNGSREECRTGSYSLDTLYAQQRHVYTASH
eukprot:scaffold2239_cov110-Skeletonema_marinoi.AAC.3